MRKFLEGTSWLKPKALIVGGGLLAIGFTAQADILAGGHIYGGPTQKQAICYIYNAGTGPATITSKAIVREPGINLSFVYDSCASNGSTLAAGASCGIAANIVNNLAHACRVVVSPSGADVRGSLELRTSTGTVLNNVELR